VFLICLHVFRQLLKYLQKEKKLVSYYCAWQLLDSAPTYSQVQWENQSYVVL
jgi:hypothetical protein